MTAMSGVSGESVLARAVRILETFDEDSPVLTVTEVARRAGLPLATASRLLGQLAEHGLVERGPDGSARIGLRMWELGARAQALDLRAAALPFLEVLHASVRQHAQLGVLDGTEVIFLERLSAPDAVVNYSRVAGRLPAHVSSSGLVLLAHAPPEVVEQVLDGPFEQLTPHTPADAAAVRRLLAAVRREDGIVARGFVHEDAAGLAVPVRRRRRVVAAVALVVPNGPTAGAHLPALRACAAAISRRLQPPSH